MKNLYGIEHQKLTTLMVAMGQKPYRATQLYKWMFEKKATDFEQMSDISKSFREVLAQEFTLKVPTIYKQQNASDGTMKLLVELEDGHKVETVLMRYKYGNVICVSSQVGCLMGCSFCASGLLRKQRDLTAAEMLGQVLVVNQLLEQETPASRVTHIVVMGTGEPFDNYENTLDFVRIANHPHGLAIGARHITVSTCGLPDKIRQYADEGLQINLAISLHAPNDEIRNQIMKINRVHNLSTLMDAVKYYEKTAGRRVTFEYILLKDVNDQIEHANQLSDLIRGTLAYVNLIPYNEVDEHGYRRSDSKTIKAFLNQLVRRGITATIRKEFGTDIDAACGQLRAKEEEKNE